VIDAQDRRAFRVRLTPAGQRLFKKMAAEHERWIVELFDGLPAKGAQQLAGLLNDLKIHVRRQTRQRLESPV
jgi:DNA-binding MarR family transcriptional regulator